SRRRSPDARPFQRPAPPRVIVTRETVAPSAAYRAMVEAEAKHSSSGCGITTIRRCPRRLASNGGAHNRQNAPTEAGGSAAAGKREPGGVGRWRGLSLWRSYV